MVLVLGQQRLVSRHYDIKPQEFLEVLNGVRDVAMKGANTDLWLGAGPGAK